MTIKNNERHFKPRQEAAARWAAARVRAVQGMNPGTGIPPFSF